MSDLTAINQTTLPDPPNPNPIPGGIDPSEIMVEVSLARYGVLQQNLKTQADEIKANNALLTDYQNVLALVDKQVPLDPSTAGDVTVNVPPDVLAALKTAGFNLEIGKINPDGTTSVYIQGGAQQLAAFLKDKIQALSNNSQMAMIELQSQMNNLNQTMQTATSILQKASDTKDKILQNIH
jgi:hypothetical protein